MKLSKTDLEILDEIIEEHLSYRKLNEKTIEIKLLQVRIQEEKHNED